LIKDVRITLKDSQAAHRPLEDRLKGARLIAEITGLKGARKREADGQTGEDVLKSFMANIQVNIDTKEKTVDVDAGSPSD